MLKTIFLGNSDFSIPTLECLYHHTDLKAIITGLDKDIIKHGKSLTHFPEPKIFGLEKNIPIFQPTDLQDPDFLQVLKDFTPDLMIVISYGRLLPEILYTIPPFGTLNLHASLLPQYRGASPIQESLLHGDTITGITLQKIDKEIDTGNILLQTKLNIPQNEIYPHLRHKLSLLASSTLLKWIAYYEVQKALMPEIKQNGIPSFCGKIKKQDGFVNFFDFTATEIYNKYRAFYTWPQVTINIKGIPVKITEMEIIFNEENLQPGFVLEADKNGFVIQAKKDAIFIKKLHPQNKKAQDYISYINGYSIKKGDSLL